MAHNLLNSNKKKYALPIITGIIVDNEITLQLNSLPPVGPGNGYNNFQQNQIDPYKHNKA